MGASELEDALEGLQRSCIGIHRNIYIYIYIYICSIRVSKKSLWSLPGRTGTNFDGTRRTGESGEDFKKRPDLKHIKGSGLTSGGCARIM